MTSYIDKKCQTIFSKLMSGPANGEVLDHYCRTEVLGLSEFLIWVKQNPVRAAKFKEIMNVETIGG